MNRARAARVDREDPAPPAAGRKLRIAAGPAGWQRPAGRDAPADRADGRRRLGCIGVRELAARVLGREVTVRTGRPRLVRGLPETASGPGFAAAIGLLAWAAGEGKPILEVTPGPTAQPEPAAAGPGLGPATFMTTE